MNRDGAWQRARMMSAVSAELRKRPLSLAGLKQVFPNRLVDAVVEGLTADGYVGARRRRGATKVLVSLRPFPMVEPEAAPLALSDGDAGLLVALCVGVSGPVTFVRSDA